MNAPTTVYTKHSCGPCMATLRALGKTGIPFVVVNLDSHPEAHADLIRAGWMQTPIVYAANGARWSGFRPDLIEQLAKDLNHGTTTT